MMFQVGDQVEVLDSIRSVWIPAHVVNRWACVRFGSVSDGPAQKNFYEYDCDGMDAHGPFHGRWTEGYVRPRTQTQ